MRTNLEVIAALIIAFAVFYAVGEYAVSLGVDRSPEKHLFFNIGSNPTDATGRYVVPILFPLDLIVMLLLSASLGWASATWGPQGLGGQAWIYLVLPLAYLAFDLAEDGLLALLLTQYIPIGKATGLLLQTLTAGKMGTILLSGAQAAIAGGAAVYRYVSG